MTAHAPGSPVSFEKQTPPEEQTSHEEGTTRTFVRDAAAILGLAALAGYLILPKVDAYNYAHRSPLVTAAPDKAVAYDGLRDLAPRGTVFPGEHVDAAVCNVDVGLALPGPDFARLAVDHATDVRTDVAQLEWAQHPDFQPGGYRLTGLQLDVRGRRLDLVDIEAEGIAYDLGAPEDNVRGKSADLGAGVPAVLVLNFASKDPACSRPA